MPAEWTGDIVKAMHLHRITKAALAVKLGFSNEYVSMVLNGKREVDGHAELFRTALDELIKEKEAQAMKAGA